MSITMEYVFNSSKPLAELAADINNCLGCQLAPYQGDVEYFFIRFLAMDLSLSENGFANDGEMDFENYRYVLKFRTAEGAGNLRTIQLPAMLMCVYALHEWYELAGMLVWDVQVLLARYESRPFPERGSPRLYDVVSDTWFLSFADHLATVAKRLPKSFADFYFYS